MAAPLITSAQITNWLKAKKTGFEVFDEFPTDMKNVRQAIYVNDPATSSRKPIALALHNEGNRYRTIDSMRIIVVTYQGDNRRDAAVAAIQDLVLDNELLDGYIERDYTMTQDYLNRAEYRTYDFDLIRLETQ
jgi:hypothetical protein